MSGVAGVVAVLAATAVGVALLWWLDRRHRRRVEDAPAWLEASMRRRVLVQTTSGQTIDGRLVAADRHGVVLHPAKLEGGPQLAGEQWIPRSQVHWIQQPPAETGSGF